MMLKYRNRWLIFLLAVMGLMLSMNSCSRKDALPSLQETYKRQDKNPMGGFAAYQILSQHFQGIPCEDSRRAFTETTPAMQTRPVLYVTINRQFLPEPEETEAILDFVHEGNTFICSSAFFDSSFLQSLQLEAIQVASIDRQAPDYFTDTESSLISPEGLATYSYYFKPVLSHFNQLNPPYSRPVGFTQQGLPNAIIYYWGKGRLILQTEPRLLSNYFLLQGNHYRYWTGLLSMCGTAPRSLMWDLAYNRRTQKRHTPQTGSAAAMSREPSMKLALFLMALALASFLIWGIRRRQRIVPVKIPNTNTSVAFTETMARLYLQQADHKDMSVKMIRYFQEQLKSRYGTSISLLDPESPRQLQQKTGISLREANELHGLVIELDQQELIRESDLIALQHKLQFIYKKA